MRSGLILSLLLAAAAPTALILAAPPALSAEAVPAGDPAARVVVDRYFAWRGGAAFEAMTTVHQKGALEVGGVKGVAERWASRDGRQRDAYDLGAFTGSSAFSAIGGWTRSQQIVDDMPPATLQDNRRQLALEFGDALRGRGGATVRRLADEARAGRTWAVLRVSFGDADTYDAFIDPASGELLGWRVVEDRKERFLRSGDWRMVDGVRTPFLLEEIHANAAENVTQRLTLAEADKPIDPALFERPVSARMASFAGGARATEPLPFEFYDDTRIIIPVTINGLPAKAPLDTGTDTTTLDTTFAAAAGIKGEQKVVGNGTGGQVEAELTHGVKVQIGSMTLTTPVAAMFDLSSIAARLGRPLPAILGGDLLKQLVVDIDFKARTIAFHDPDSFAPPAGAILVPLTMTDNVPSLTASIEGGPEVSFDFDIGNATPVLLFPAYWQPRHMLENRPYSKTKGGGAGGLSDEIATTLKTVTFAGVTLHDVPAVLTKPGAGAVDSDRRLGNIGMPIYSRFRLITDYPHKRLWLIPNATTATAPFRRDRAGLSFVYEGDHLRVIVVAGGSPAEAQGWKVGDLITSVDGKKIGPDFPGSPADHWTSAAAGARVRLTGPDGRTRVLILRDFF